MMPHTLAIGGEVCLAVCRQELVSLCHAARLDQLRLGLHGRIARPMRGKDFDQASERSFAVFRVLKLKAKLGGFIADKMGKRERHFLRAHVSDGAVSSAHDVAAAAAAACDADSEWSHHS